MLTRLKAAVQGFWQPLGGPRRGGMTFQGFGHPEDDPAPSTADLLAAYEETVYACVSVIAQNVGQSRFRLCVTTQQGEPFPAQSRTRALEPREVRRLQKAVPLARKAVGVEEIIDHPLIDLLERPNPRQSGAQFIAATSGVLELAGEAFWYIARSGGYPAELWLLPTLSITPQIDDKGQVTGFVQNKGSGDEVRMAPQDVVWFRGFNPLDPYNAAGVSPVQSVWRRVIVGRREMSSWAAVLANLAYPSAMVAPPDGESFTDAQANRLAKEYTQRFGLGRQGGIWVVQDPLKFTPVSSPPKDLAALQLYDQIKTAVCNAYMVPRPLLDMMDSNFASAETAKRSFQEYCLLPRVTLLLAEINRHLVQPVSPRLFLDAGEVVQADKQFELTRTTSLVTSNIATINEGRKAQGLEPIPGMDRFLFQVQAPAFPPAPPAAPPKGKGIATKSDDLVAGQLGGVLSRLFSEMEQEVLQRVQQELEAGKAWVDLANWTDRMRQTCAPFIRLSMTQGFDNILSQLGGDPTMRLAAIPKLDEAVDAAVLAFAQSTLGTAMASVDQAVADVREQIRAGLSRGEGAALLTSRVQQVFQGLSEYRAYLIADTESTRARHAGELLMARESGVEVKKKWLADSRACPICRTADGMVRELDEPFWDTLEGGPYSVVMHPPGHPGCRCSQVYVQ